MRKIDRLGWAAGVCFDSYGWRLGVRVNEPEAFGRVLECLPPGWLPCDSPFVEGLYSLRLGGDSDRAGGRQYHQLYSGVGVAAHTMDLDEAYDALETELQMKVAEWARDRLFVHAGVVGWRGKAIVVPGRTRTGKSSLIAALLRAGAEYYSDEYAVLDEQGWAHPYPRRLSLRQPDGGRPLRRTAEELGARRGAGPLPIGLVALPRYMPGARWKPALLSPGRALLEIFNHTVPAQSRPELALTILQRLVPRTTVVKGPRGDADETAEALLQALSN